MLQKNLQVSDLKINLLKLLDYFYNGNFVSENLLQYVTTMVCVSIKNKPIIGVIHKPFESKSTYWAWVDHGVSSNLNNRVLVKNKKINLYFEINIQKIINCFKIF